jgi:hypothetical protein
VTWDGERCGRIASIWVREATFSSSLLSEVLAKGTEIDSALFVFVFERKTSLSTPEFFLSTTDKREERENLLDLALIDFVE